MGATVIRPGLIVIASEFPAGVGPVPRQAMFITFDERPLAMRRPHVPQGPHGHVELPHTPGGKHLLKIFKLSALPTTFYCRNPLGIIMVCGLLAGFVAAAAGQAHNATGPNMNGHYTIANPGADARTPPLFACVCCLFGIASTAHCPRPAANGRTPRPSSARGHTHVTTLATAQSHPAP